MTNDKATMEIERKWVIYCRSSEMLSSLKEHFKRLSSNIVEDITQGYVKVGYCHHLRLRRKNDKFYMTYKIPSVNDSDIGMFEWETEIPQLVFLSLWEETNNRFVHKERIVVPCADGVFECDFFKTPNLCYSAIIEREFASEKEAKEFVFPMNILPGIATTMQNVQSDVQYVLIEVTKDEAYSNRSLTSFETVEKIFKKYNYLFRRN